MQFKFNCYFNRARRTVSNKHDTGKRCICCGSILSLVESLFSFVFGYGNIFSLVRMIHL